MRSGRGISRPYPGPRTATFAPMARALSEVVATLRADPASTAILLDFDGTLAPIVDDPASATAVPGAREALSALVGAYRTVAVISGRPVRFLREQLGDGPTLVGLYGLERIEGGREVEAPEATGWRPVVGEVVAAARADLSDRVGVEDKGLSVTLHYRTAPSEAASVEAWATSAASRWGLEARPAKMSVELHPPIEVDKGTAVAGLLDGSAAACFVGDDVGDIPAFEALARFGEAGGQARSIVVSSVEMAPELVGMADLIVRDTSEVLELLRDLDPSAEPGSDLIG